MTFLKFQLVWKRPTTDWLQKGGINTSLSKKEKIRKLMEVSGIEEEIDDFIKSWLNYVTKECADDAYSKYFDLSLGEIEGLKDDIETLKTRYHERSKVIKEKIFEDIALEINSISEESIDRSIAYWESADGQMFKTTIAVASEKINTFLPDACNAAIREIAKNITEESPSQLGLLFSDN